MSSLQQQLAAIAATSTHQLDLKAQKAAHGKSLLFEPRQAASQDFNTIFQICYEGFEELRALDSRFTAFSQNLFSEQSKSEDRTQMTMEENRELDVVLERFLDLLSSRLLLKPAVKTVEWLVRRFRIHEYNTELTILTFLPYHTTPIFPTLLSIIPHQIPNNLRFLFPYVTSLTNPPYRVLVYSAINTSAFFSALNQYVLRLAKSRCHSSHLLSFWAGLATQAVDGVLDTGLSGRANIQRQRQEDALLRILPFLNEAISIKNVQELTMGCYMIATVLAKKGDFEDKVLDALMEAVAPTLSSDLLDSGLLCLSAIAQERNSTRLPKSVTKKLLKQEKLVGQLKLLSQRCSVGRLALGFIMAVLARSRSSDRDFAMVWKTLESQLLDESHFSGLVKHILSRANVIGSSKSPPDDKAVQLLLRVNSSELFGPQFRQILDDEKLNIEQLELKLNTVIEPLPTSDQDADGDEIMGDGENPQDSPSTFDAVVAALPARTTSTDSFLSFPVAPLFSDLAQAFMAASLSQGNVDKFATMPLFGGQPTLFVSFCLRFACGSHPASARSAALHAIIRWQANSQSYDLQAMIPYVVVALADDSQRVRRAAAGCAKGLADLYSAGQGTGKATKSNLLGVNTLYGSSTKDIDWLTFDDATKLVSNMLLPTVEECILDSAQIGNFVEVALNGSSANDVHNRIGSIELKSALRQAAFAFLSGHAVQTASMPTRLRLLSMLGRVGRSGSAARTSTVIPSLRQWAGLSISEAAEQCRFDAVDVSQVDRAYLDALSSRERETVETLRSIMGGKTGEGRQSLQDAAFTRLQALWSALKSDDKLQMAQFLFNTSIESKESWQQEAATAALRDLPVPADILSALVNGLPEVPSMPDGPPSAKRRRTSRGESTRVNDANVNAADVLRKYNLLLELVESSRTEPSFELLKGLFRVLRELQKFKAQSNSSLVYLESLVISGLSSTVEKLKTTDSAQLHKSVIEIDLLVDTVRSSSSSQVHNAALLLISNLAAWMPDLVLHGVMPIFTFMGTTLLRRGDDYSAHVIDQTVEKVVPPLTASMRRRNQPFLLTASDLLLSFTAAFEHIPNHRRLNLFTHLVKTLGPSDCLYAIAALLIDKFRTDSKVRHFLKDLMRAFGPREQLFALRQYTALLKSMNSAKLSVEVDRILNVKGKTSEQIEESSVSLMDSLAQLADDPQLRSRLTKLVREDNDTSSEIQSLYSEWLKEIMAFSRSTKKESNCEPNKLLSERCMLTGSTVYLASERALSSILRVLPTTEFIKSFAVVLDDSDDDETRKSFLNALQGHVRRVKQGDESSIRALLSFLDKLTNLVQRTSDRSLQQSAIACTDLISESFGKKDPTAISSAATVIASDTILGSPDERIRVISLLCLASMVEVLRDDFVPMVPRAFSEALKYPYLENSDKASEDLHNARYALLIAVVEHIPYIMSVDDLLLALEMSLRSAEAKLGEEADECRAQFYQVVASNIEAKKCFAAVNRCTAPALHTSPEAFHEFLDFLDQALKHHSKATIIKTSGSLFSILFNLFEILNLQWDRQSETVVDEKEQRVISFAISVVMKLNDATFRPFFIKLVEWATKLLSATRSDADAVSAVSRCKTLFRFLEVFNDRLQSIVTSYSSYVLEPAASILQARSPASGNEELREADRLSRIAVLRALRKSFQHDQDDFWQAPSHFSAIVAPLLSQLSTITDTTTVSEEVIPAITEFAAAAVSPEHQKEMNSMILKLMRSDDASVRLAAVKCERSLIERLGEDWLALLAEMLPFISELQEDDDEIVERETLRWIKRIEEVLGESIEGMLQ